MRSAAQLVAGVAFALSLSTSLTAHANLTIGQGVTVQATGVYGQVVNISSPGFYTGGAWAGIYNLSVNGQAMQGFCIDPWQFDPASPSPYTVSALGNAPDNDPPGAMGAANATEIGKLWTCYFQPGMTTGQARNLQLAIWLITGGPTFQITDAAPAGYSSWDAWLSAYEASAANAAPTELVALSSRTQQDYVVPNVPDGGTTLGLLSAACTALAFWRRKR